MVDAYNQNAPAPKVGVVCGSDSDLPVVSQALKELESLGIPFEVNVLSAHRTPDQAAEYARTAEQRGLRVLIACAGGAAHLPGVLAAYTLLPVIGVPIKSGALSGWDALLAIAQMPPGVPVATVAVDGARNAAILAAQILATGDPAVREAVRRAKARMAEQVLEKNRRLQEVGWKEYGGAGS